MNSEEKAEDVCLVIIRQNYIIHHLRTVSPCLKQTTTKPIREIPGLSDFWITDVTEIRFQQPSRPNVSLLEWTFLARMSIILYIHFVK